MTKFWLAMVLYFIFDLLAIATTAKWLKSDDITYRNIAFIAYTICNICWLAGLTSPESPKLANALTIYSVCSIFPALLTAIIVSGEVLTPKDVLGIILGLLSVLILTR